MRRKPGRYSPPLPERLTLRGKRGRPETDNMALRNRSVAKLLRGQNRRAGKR